MFTGTAQPSKLLTPSGQQETIDTLKFAYMLVRKGSMGHALIVGRDGKDGREAIDVSIVRGLKSFIKHAVQAAMKAGGKMQILHYHSKDAGSEMKIAVEPDFDGMAYRITALPLDFPLDPEGQREYDMTKFEAEYQARFMTRH
ncbi:hypothetical protein [Agrobacterium pusense]|uniref:hypothetical protein n=1 Tax=Agrobacterium pusense TaxID=648995 RepID=UPI000D3B5908|nr:hypothetical protein [Agrobacterium pusense]PTV70250.1 hypothetical protein DBL06_25640 [Agrobacterium pusense]